MTRPPAGTGLVLRGVRHIAPDVTLVELRGPAKSGVGLTVKQVTDL